MASRPSRQRPPVIAAVQAAIAPSNAAAPAINARITALPVRGLCLGPARYPRNQDGQGRPDLTDPFRNGWRWCRGCELPLPDRNLVAAGSSFATAEQTIQVVTRLCFLREQTYLPPMLQRLPPECVVPIAEWRRDDFCNKRCDPPHEQAIHSVLKLGGIACVNRRPHATSNVSTKPERRERYQNQV